MKTIDLTHTITETMPVFPGTEPPKLTDACTLEKDGFREKLLSMYSHTGTHMDAPSHMINGQNLDDFPVDQFIGSVLVVEANSYEVGLDQFVKFEKKLKESDFVLLKTNWDEKWGKDIYYTDFPAISKEAAEYLTLFNLKGYGIDAISVDHMENIDFTVHHILLNNNMILIENLRNLDQVETGDMLAVLPLKIKESDGSPIRALAMKFD